MKQQQRAENQAETLKVHEEMAGAKARMEIYRSHDEVNAGEGSKLREDGNNNQKEIVRHTEENSCSRLPRVLNRKDVDEGQIAMRQSKEVRQEVQSTKINMQIDRVYNATPKQRTKEFKSNKHGNQNEKDNGLTGMMCKLLSQKSAPNADFDLFDGNLLEFNYFMSIFEDMVGSKVNDPRSRLTRLINYTKGEAKELMKHCIQQPTEVCYDNAKNL